MDHPDLVIDAPVVAVELRWPDRWQTVWYADLGAAVALAVDERLETAPAGTTLACARGWCDRCRAGGDLGPGSRAQPCPCACHTGTSTQ